MKDKGIQLNNDWAKPKVEKLKLLKGIASIIKDKLTLNYLGMPGDAKDAIESIKFDDKPGKIGWKLISRSLVDALLNLIVEYNLDFKKEFIEIEDLDIELNKVLETKKHFVDVDFFKNPEKLPLIKALNPVFNEFLLLFELKEREIENILSRLPSYFVFSLINEWRTNQKYYSELKSNLITPFDEAGKRESDWYLYSKWLNKQVDKPVFSESFGLRQIYVPLRAYYKKKIEKNEKHIDERIGRKEHHKIVIELSTELNNWIRKGDKDDSIRIIRGGPGYGKSSFLKMFATEQANHNRKVLFIPLHLFSIEDDLTESVKKFIGYDKYLNSNPFDEERLILLFDGLDELSMQGKVLADIASQFIREVERKVSLYNSSRLKIQIIISGRDVIIQQNESEFRKEKQILSLLPYYLNKEEKKEYSDPQTLLTEDQRTQWWQKYGEVKGKGYKGLPKNLQNRELDEITAQPLLNYLVALSFERGKINFSGNTNLNEIYNDLLEAIYERNYSDGKILEPIRKLLKNDFKRMLEEIAVSSWHGNSRTTTVAEIENHFKEGGLSRLLNDFIKDAEKGVVSLLAAFYFRQAGQNTSGNQTFEFTHKSFGEYLTSKRIINKINLIHENRIEQLNDYDKGWTSRACLGEWIKVFGPKEIDSDLLKFINNELRLENDTDHSKLNSLQETIIILISLMLKDGLPMEDITPRQKFNMENEQAINAERALLIILSSIAAITDKISKISWPSGIAFGNWINRISPQRTGPSTFINRFFNHFDLSNSMLDIKDLYRANLTKTNLNSCKLHYANLMTAELKEVDLGNASLNWANLKNANLLNTNLQRADLEGANLEGAHLEGANLEGSNMEEANLKNANLKGTNLKGTNLKGANLKGANMEGANIEGANFKGTILHKRKIN